MKILITAQILEVISSSFATAVILAPVNEVMRYGFDSITVEKNPFWHRSPVVIWWEESSPLAIYHRKGHPNLGDFALLFEKPVGIPRSIICQDDTFFDALLEDAVEVGVV